MPNLENFLVYENWQYDVIRHLFSLTVAMFLAGFVYFVLTSGQASPRYRLASQISAVVMVSAVLEIAQLSYLWATAFSFSDGLWRPVGDSLFSNGFRYVNWSIDVPMLLTQLLVVLGPTGAVFWKTWWKIAGAGFLMIWTGYPGQFYEPAVAGLVPGEAGAPFWIWGAISTAFFVYLVYKVGMLIGRPPEPLSPKVKRNLIYCWWILLISWSLYPFAYLMPAILPDANGIVVRQVLFTVADVTSKLLFGVVLGRVVKLRSQELGWEPALLADAEGPPPRAPLREQVVGERKTVG